MEWNAEQKKAGNALIRSTNTYSLAIQHKMWAHW